MSARIFNIALLSGLLAATSAPAEKLTVSQYGRIIATLPWAVALEKGFFKEANLDVDGITAGAGGGTSVRNMLAGSLPFAELSTSAVVAAVKAGVELKIVDTASNHPGELAWASKPNANIKSIKDLVGKKIGFTNPKSTTEMVLRAAVAKEGLAGKIELLAMGGLGPAITALNQGAIAAALREKVWPLIEAGKIRPVIDSTFKLVEAPEAHLRLETSLHIGKVVLVV